MAANMYSESREEARDYARLRNVYFEQVSVYVMFSFFLMPYLVLLYSLGCVFLSPYLVLDYWFISFKAKVSQWYRVVAWCVSKSICISSIVKSS